MEEALTFSELAKKITSLPHKHRQRIIAIDGGGGAGKTTFASCLQKEIPGSRIVKVDDFYLPPQLRAPVLSMDVINPNFDWDRIRRLVLDAVIDDKDISYQLHDFKNGTLTGEVIQVPRDATIILEGVWSMQKAFADLYDYCIWLEAPADLRLERGVSRDGEELRQVWVDEWIPIDDSYKKTQKPHLRADLIVDSAKSDFEKDQIVLTASITTL
jgi:uridine kinase